MAGEAGAAVAAGMDVVAQELTLLARAQYSAEPLQASGRTRLLATLPYRYRNSTLHNQMR